MMKRSLTYTIPTYTTTCEIEIESGILSNTPLLAKALSQLGSQFAMITDDLVANLYGRHLCDSLSSSGIETTLFTFPSGEDNKTRETKMNLENHMLEKQMGKDTCLIAIGGGVVTDIAGFIASTYCRGIPLVLMPTSLLAMVDASSGGKTGVNTPFGKNMIGSIYRPKRIIIDPLVLRSLPLREIKNGIVEVIKHGLIADRGLFEYLEDHADQLLSRDPQATEKIIFESCRIKNDIVVQDERESGIRHLLNFGHTVGHALEQLTHYSILHGEAVAIGILVECHMAMQLGYLKKETFDRIHSIFIKFQLPLKTPTFIPARKILEMMVLDKKSVKKMPRFVSIDDIGSSMTFNSKYCNVFEESIVLNALNWMNNDLCCN